MNKMRWPIILGKHNQPRGYNATGLSTDKGMYEPSVSW